MLSVELTKIVEKLELKNLTPDVELKDRTVHVPDVNRPGLQMAGFFDHFETERLQIIGYVEYTYLETLTPEERCRIYENLLSHNIPCIIYCRGLSPEPKMLELAKGA